MTGSAPFYMSAGISEDDWIDIYKPLPHPRGEAYGYDYGQGSCLIETFGQDVAYLETIPENRIWTVVDDDNGDPLIISGRHFVNRIGYIVTANEWPVNAVIEVLLDPIDEQGPPAN